MSYNSFTDFLGLFPVTEQKEIEDIHAKLSPVEKADIDKLVGVVQDYDIDKLIGLIQPIWNKAHIQTEVSEMETLQLMIGLFEYKKRGLDVAYFTSGSGAPGNCLIL